MTTKFDKKSSNFYFPHFLVGFRVIDHKFGVKKLKFKMTHPIWRPNFIKNYPVCIKLILTEKKNTKKFVLYQSDNFL